MEPYFEKNKNQSDIMNINLPFYVGCQETEHEGYHIPPHWHYHIEIIYMAFGDAVITIGSEVFSAKKGDLLLIHPCEVHSVSVPTGLPSLHYVIGFDPELLRPMPQMAFQFGFMFPYISSLNERKKNVSINEHDISLIENMYLEYRDKAPCFELSVISMLYKLVVQLFRNAQSHPFGLDFLSSEHSGKWDAFRRTLHYLNANCHERIKATDVAKLSMMSYSRFASLFKTIMQTSLVPYLMFLRIRKAEQELLDISKSITQIALETGFNSPSYFIKHFKRAKGISPLQYRNKMLLPSSYEISNRFDDNHK